MTSIHKELPIMLQIIFCDICLLKLDARFLAFDRCFAPTKEIILMGGIKNSMKVLRSRLCVPPHLGSVYRVI
jgi:hypothetical protein